MLAEALTFTDVTAAIAVVTDAITTSAPLMAIFSCAVVVAAARVFRHIKNAAM